MATSTDKHFAGLIRRDAVVVKSIYTDFAPRIETMISRNGGNQQDARDIFQEALLIIWRKSNNPDFQLTSSFYTFLYSICFNLWLRRQKKKDNNTVTISDAGGLQDEGNIQEDLEKNERLQIFRRHLETLGPECRRLLSMFFAGKKMRDIAKSLNIDNDHAARNRKYRCQKKLEDKIMVDPRYIELTNRP